MMLLQAIPGRYYLLPTETEAEALQDQIFQAYVAQYPDVNAASGEPVDPQITTCWAVPAQTITGHWAVPVPQLDCGVGLPEVELSAGDWPVEEPYQP